MYPEYQKKLGKRIKALREENSITQQELASLCDFEKSNMSRIEAGRTNPTIGTLLKISHALNINITVLVDVES
jgi:transcriptional regulator with XRE-family HTH domain